MEKFNNADVLKESFFCEHKKNLKRAEGREGCALRQASICLPYVVQLPNKIHTYKLGRQASLRIVTHTCRIQLHFC